MSATRPRRLAEIDHLRAIAIVTVLFVHVSSGFASRGPVSLTVLYFDMLMDTLAHYAIPLFTLVSGFSLALGYYAPLDVRRFYTKRLLRTVPPFLLFSVLYTLGPLLRGEIGLARALLNLFTGRAEYHLYFFVVIIPLYLLYPLLVRLHQRTAGRHLRVLAALALLQTVWWALSLIVSYRDVVTVAGHALRGGALGLLQFMVKRAFVMYLFYFYLGICCARAWPELKPRLLAWGRAWWRPALLGLAIVGLISYLFAVRFDLLQPPQLLAFAVQAVVELCIYTAAIYLLYLLANAVAQRPTFWSALGLQLSRMSMGIYLVHVAVQRMVDWALSALNLMPPTLVAYRYALLVTLTVTVLVVQALSHLPGAQLWLGVGPARLDLTQAACEGSEEGSA
ncbi:MAG: acyltransferase [Chloroflexi bacterium]|nr:acyltransferase [Chloroflexota bacterium]